MGKITLSSKVVLILASEPILSHSLKNSLEKKVRVVYLASNVHEAVIHAIMTEPDFIFIEISPSNLSGLQLLDTLKQLKGLKINQHFFIFTEKKFKESFLQKAKGLLFLDEKETSSTISQMESLLESSFSPGDEESPVWMAYKERGESYPVSRNEQEILEKLGQLGILKRK